MPARDTARLGKILDEEVEPLERDRSLEQVIAPDAEQPASLEVFEGRDYRSSGHGPAPGTAAYFAPGAGTTTTYLTTV